MHSRNIKTLKYQNSEISEFCVRIILNTQLGNVLKFHSPEIAFRQWKPLSGKILRFMFLTDLSHLSAFNAA